MELKQTLSIQLTYGTSRTYNATWDFSFFYPAKHIKHYEYEIQYHIAGEKNNDGKERWHAPNNWGRQTTKGTYITFPTIDDNVDKFRIRVKPVSKTYTIKNKTGKKNKKGKKEYLVVETTYFVGSWTSWCYKVCGVTVTSGGESIPTIPELVVPATPTLELNNYTLTASTTSNDTNVGSANMEIYKDGTLIAAGKPAFVTGKAVISTNVYANGSYAARVAGISTDGTRQSDWSDWGRLDVNLSPSTPAVPSVEIVDGVLTAQVNNLNFKSEQVLFEVVKDNSQCIYSNTVAVATGHAQIQCNVAPGGAYKVRARAYNGSTGYWSEYSEYSSNISTPPSPPKNFTSYKATSTTSVELQWIESSGATSYEIQYVNDKKLFDTSSGVSSVTVDSSTANITGLETGNEWFFRVRSKNDAGTSAWCSEIVSVIIGEPPAAPQTWSNRTVVAAGTPVMLYWVHNSRDNSSQTYAEIEVYLNGTLQEPTILVQNGTDEPTKDKTSSYELQTTGYPDGSILTWRVRTKGVMESYGDWSTMREIDIYTNPSLEVTFDGGISENIEYPIKLHAAQFPTTQKVMEYYVEVKAVETHEGVDYTGEEILISKGQVMFSKHYYTNAAELDIIITPADALLVGEEEYQINVSVATDIGLNAEWSGTFTISQDAASYVISCEVGVNYDDYSVNLHPSIRSAEEEGTDVSDIVLSIYRKEVDGKFTLIQGDIPGNTDLYYIDPHPALDYARYRVLALLPSGQIIYSDIPDMPIQGDSIVIQWDETNKPYDIYNNGDEDEDGDQIGYQYADEYSKTGYMLELPYNIDVSDSISQDVEHVQYIGREHPVSYHGTQLGETSTWNADVSKDDEETLYMLRMLRVYMGNVYVREPSGSGYWATVSVSFNRKHDSLVMPVTLAITRVEGGV